MTREKTIWLILGDGPLGLAQDGNLRLRSPMDDHVYFGFGLSFVSFFGRYAARELPKSVAWAGIAAGVFVMSVPLWGDDMKPPAGVLIFAVAGFLCFGMAAHLYHARQTVGSPTALHSESQTKRHYTKKTAGEILAPYKTNEPLFAFEQVKPFFGEWIVVDVTIQGISPITNSEAAVFFSKEPEGNLINGTFALSSMKRVRQVRTGDNVKIRGQISGASPSILALENTEIVDEE